MSEKIAHQLKPVTSFSPVPALSGVLRRKCACGGSAALTGECEECRKKSFEGSRVSGLVQRRAAVGHNVSEVPPIVHEVLHSPGQPLDATTRAFFEPRFGHDLSKVRIHTDARAAESARAVDALAYTVGQNIVFGATHYAPETKSGRKLLAHELTHAAQSVNENGPVPFKATEPNDPEELQAYRAAEAVDAGEPLAAIAATPPGLTRLRPTSTPGKSDRSPSAPEIYKRNTELGGLTVGNFDFHFKDCAILVWVWLKFKFTSNITAPEQASFKKRFLDAVHGVWGNSGWHLTGDANCPCSYVPIQVHAEENPKSYCHKLVDVERKTDVKRRPSVISDINVNLFTDDQTLAHEFGHVLGLYDEYDGGFFENIMFWHRNRPDDRTGLMNIGSELRPRYFEHYRRTVQKGAPKGCDYGISSPLPPS